MPDAPAPGFVHRRTVTIEWGDCDPAGIVFYPRYFALFDASTGALFRAALGMTKPDWTRRFGIIGIPMVDTRGKFRTEAQAYGVAELLIKAGADVNAQEFSQGQTALFGAATNGWNSVVQLLADNGADLAVKDAEGATPLDAALGRGGRFGRGDGGDQHVETAALIEKLLAEKAGR